MVKPPSEHNGNHQATPRGIVTLSPAQFSKLWQLMTGGCVTMGVSGGQPVVLVSLDSFETMLPVLLERLLD